MLRNLKILATGLLSVSIALAGCSASGSSKSASSENGKVTLEFLQNKPEVVKEWDKLISAFEKKNPTITVKQINPPNTDTTLQADLAKGKVPDVIAMGADATFIQMAKNNVFKDLSDTSEVKQVSEAYVKMLKDEVGKSNVYALPYTVNAVPIIYNEDLFNKYNLKVPTTWDELMAEAKQIKDAGGTPFYNGFKDAWTTAPIWNALTTNTEPSSFQKDLVSNKADFTKDNAIAVDHMKQFASFGNSDQYGVAYNDANVAFANGKSVFYAQGIWTLPVIRQTNPDIKLNTFVVPASNDASKVKMVSGVDSLIAVANSGNSKQEKAALKFINFLLDKNNAAEYANIAGLFSTVNGVENSDKALEPLQQYIAKGDVADFDDHYYPPAMAAGNQYESILQGTLSKNLSTKEILKQLDSLYKQSASHK